jgi:hypothetical protein
MKVRDALGLGPAAGRTVVPVRIWLPLAIALMAVATLLLRVIDVAPSTAGFVGVSVGAALAIPLSAVITRRGRRNG